MKGVVTWKAVCCQLWQERKSGPGLRKQTHRRLMLGTVSSPWRCHETSRSFCFPGGPLLATEDWRNPSKRTTLSYLGLDFVF